MKRAGRWVFSNRYTPVEAATWMIAGIVSTESTLAGITVLVIGALGSALGSWLTRSWA